MIQMLPSVAVSAVVNSIRQFYDAGSGVTQTTMLGASGSVPALYEDFTTGQTLDPRITFTRASNATRFDSTGTLVTMANNEPRFNYDPVTLQPKGLLIEEQRTNSIRNNTMQGAAVGTPGTFPTNWPSIGTGHGITSEIVGVGVEGGISYVDFRFTGTATNSNFTISAEGALVIAAVNGQSWSGSWFMKIVSASAPPLNYVNRIRLNDSTGAGVGQIDTLFTPTTTLSRYVSAGTISIAGTAYVQPQIRFGMTIGSSYDFTVRIGMPQIEQGAFATSVIPTSGAAATRAADVAVMTGTNFSSWYRQNEGTLFVEVEGALATATYFVANFTDGTTEVASIRNFSNTARFTAQGVPSASAGATVPGQFYKAAFAFASGDQGMSVNGGSVLTGVTAITTAPTQLRIGQNVLGGSFLTAHYKRLTYYPRRLSNAELQSITS